MASATILVNGSLHTVFAGGAGNSSAVDVYFHANRSLVQRVVNLTVGRTSPAAIAHGQYILIIGGTVGVASPVVDVLDMLTLSLVSSFNLLTPRRLHAVAALGRYVYVAGIRLSAILFGSSPLSRRH